MDVHQCDFENAPVVKMCLNVCASDVGCVTKKVIYFVGYCWKDWLIKNLEAGEGKWRAFPVAFLGYVRFELYVVDCWELQMDYNWPSKVKRVVQNSWVRWRMQKDYFCYVKRDQWERRYCSLEEVQSHDALVVLYWQEVPFGDSFSCGQLICNDHCLCSCMS